MSNEIDKFNFFRSYYDGIRKLPKKLQAEAYQQIMEYMFDGVLPEEEGAAFAFVKHHLEQTKSKIQAGSKQNDSRTEANQKQTDSKLEADEEQNESKTIADSTEQEIEEEQEINKKEKNSQSSRFKPPTQAEVEEFLITKKQISKDRASPIAQEFIEFYGSKGWKVGKTPMVNWELACSKSLRWESIQNILHNKSSPEDELSETERKIERTVKRFEQYHIDNPEQFNHQTEPDIYDENNKVKRNSYGIKEAAGLTCN